MQESNALIDVSIVMPVYNEEKIIGDAIRKTYITMKSSEFRFEIIAINDGSNDGSLEELKKLENIAVVESYSSNKGKGYALITGAKMAKGKKVVFYDSDLNIEPHHILHYLDYSLENNSEVVIGSKRIKGSESSNTLFRSVLSILFHLFTKVLLDVRVMDSQVGLKLLDHRVVEKVLPHLTIYQYAFDIELLTLCNEFGFHTTELPVKLKIRNENSTISLKAIERMFVDTWRVYCRHSKNKIVRKVFLSRTGEQQDEYSRAA